MNVLYAWKDVNETNLRQAGLTTQSLVLVRARTPSDLMLWSWKVGTP